MNKDEGKSIKAQVEVLAPELAPAATPGIEGWMICGMCRDHIDMAARMARIGNFTMARAELEAALKLIGQIERKQKS